VENVGSPEHFPTGDQENSQKRVGGAPSVWEALERLENKNKECANCNHRSDLLPAKLYVRRIVKTKIMEWNR
jgi:hypothetical protein